MGHTQVTSNFAELRATREPCDLICIKWDVLNARLSFQERVLPAKAPSVAIPHPRSGNPCFHRHLGLYGELWSRTVPVNGMGQCFEYKKWCRYQPVDLYRDVSIPTVLVLVLVKAGTTLNALARRSRLRRRHILYLRRSSVSRYVRVSDVSTAIPGNNTG